mgnify:CR=1 FL=1
MPSLAGLNKPGFVWRFTGSSSSPQPLGFGPGGLGGGAQADFDTLIELITATIAPDTWDDVGGEGSIHPKFVDFVAYAKEIGYSRVQTVSNGVMFSRRIARWAWAW